MRIFRLIIISIIVLFLILTGISLFIPSEVRISKAVQINQPPDSVLAQIAEPVNWRNWYPANDSIRLLYENGRLTGIELGEDTKLVITEKKENEVLANYRTSTRIIATGWKIVPAPGSAAIEWYMNFHLDWYPWKKFSSLLFEKRYGPAMEQGLNNLKQYLENDHSSNK